MCCRLHIANTFVLGLFEYTVTVCVREREREKREGESKALIWIVRCHCGVLYCPPSVLIFFLFGRDNPSVASPLVE